MARLELPERTVSVPHGFCSTLTFDWQMLAPLENRGRPVVFVHLLDRPAHVVRTFDHVFSGQWTPGGRHQQKVDICQPVLAPPLVEGSYLLSVGMYDSKTEKRWPLITGGEEIGTREYRIGSIVVTRGESVEGSLEIAGEGETVPTDDSQVVVRRFLKGPTTISIRRKMADKLRVVIGMQDRGTPITVSNRCQTGEERTLRSGHHVLEMTACEGGQIGIDPRKADVSLESITWKR